jgi:S-adenosylmethionine:tRNA ribosyltransferase-isomerase
MSDYLSEFDFNFPLELIAKEPASPRDSSRLMVVSRESGEVSLNNFNNIGKHLPAGSLIVFNDTKVVPSRFEVKKPSGGKAILTAVGILDDSIKVMSDRRLDLDMELTISSEDVFKVLRQEEKYFFIDPGEKFKSSGIIEREKIYKLFGLIGEAPLPPYIKNSPLSKQDIKDKYQSVFADKEGSYAAPTASLHFTEELIEKLKADGHSFCFVTLHVGLGTFAPLTGDNIVSGKLHKEFCEISNLSAEMILTAKKQKRPVIAVGTTAMRTLESFYQDGNIISGKKETDLFIREGYKFKVADGLITNFHIPRSSLLMLVSAFAGKEKIMAAYNMAIKEKFRLFSFGDAMLII